MSLKRRREESTRRSSKWKFERSAFVVCFLSVYLLGPWKTDLDSSSVSDDVVFAYYYPNYVADTWTIHPLNDKPALGHYESDNPTIASRHITWAGQNGINGFAVPWTGPSTVGDSSLRKGLLSAENANSIRFFLVYNSVDRFRTAGPEGTVDFNNQTARSIMISDLIYLRDTFLQSRSYYTIGGLPVLALRNTRMFQNFDSVVWKDMQNEAGISVFSIGDECALELPDPGPESSTHVFDKSQNGEFLESTIFDAYFAFTIYKPRLVENDDTAFLYYQRILDPQYQKWASVAPFFPTLVPEYMGWGNKPMFGNPSDFAAQVALSRKLPLKRVSDTVRSIFFISSFNEWFEGSCLEPSKRTGYDYLNVLKSSFSA